MYPLLFDGDRQVWNNFNTGGPHTTNHIRELAQQTEEESLPCAPKHLHIDQHIQDIKTANEVKTEYSVTQVVL